MTFTLSQTPTNLDCYIYPYPDDTVAMRIFPTTPTTHYDKVNDTADASNEDTNYIYCNTPTAKLDMFNCINHPPEATGTINYVQIFSRAKSYPLDQAITGEYRHKSTSTTGTVLSGNYAPLPSSYRDYSTVYATRPGGGVWTWSDIDSLKIGVQASSPLVANGSSQEYLLPVANGTYAEWETRNYLNVDDPVGSPDTTTYDLESRPAPINHKNSYKTASHVSSGTTPGSLTVFTRLYISWNGVGDYVSLYQPGVGSTAEQLYSYFYDPGWYDFTFTFPTRPAGGAWTWTDIDALEIVHRCVHTYTSQNPSYALSSTYLIAPYTFNLSPDIRTTQCYARVNYIPATSTVTLISPSEVRYTNTRRNERFIFPDGKYCIGDYGRAGKHLSLKGTEVTNAITEMRQLRTMMSIPSPVTISGLSDVNQDIAWRLNDFNYEYDSSGDHYDWNADLTSYDAVV